MFISYSGSHHQQYIVQIRIEKSDVKLMAKTKLVKHAQKKGHDCTQNHERWHQSELNKNKTKQGILVNSEISSNKDLHHIETNHVT